MNRDKIDLIFHPVRLRLLTAMIGRQMTTRALAQALPDVPQATLYRHIKRLVEGEIFLIVAEEMVNGALERTYELAAGAERLSPEELQGLSAEDHVRYFSVFAASLVDTFTQYIEQADVSRIIEDGLSYNEAMVYLNAEERTEFQEKVIGLIGSVMQNRPGPGRRGYTLASIVIPAEQME